MAFVPVTQLNTTETGYGADAPSIATDNTPVVARVAHPHRPAQKPITDRTTVINLLKLKDLFSYGNKLGHEEQDLFLANFLEKVPKLKGSLNTGHMASILFAHKTRSEEKQMSKLSDLSNLPLEILRDHISHILSDFDQQDVKDFFKNACL